MGTTSNVIGKHNEKYSRAVFSSNETNQKYELSKAVVHVILPKCCTYRSRSIVRNAHLIRFGVYSRDC